jgi:hypothetical protein
MQAAILELHTHIASYLADDVQKYFLTIDREIQYIQRTLATQMTWSDRQAVLQALLDANENFASVSIVDHSGQELLKAYNPALDKDARLLARTDNATFRKFWKKPEASALSAVYFREDTPYIDIIYPLGPEHCLFMTVSLNSLWNEITATRIASTGYAFMVDEKGTIIAHPQKEFMAAGAGTVGEIRLGATVRLKDLEYGDELEYTLVGSVEADPMKHKISNESPVGKAIIGKKKGAVVEVEAPVGHIKYEILDVQ